MIEVSSENQLGVLSPEVAGLLVCPACGHELTSDGETIYCGNNPCSARYRFSDGIPVLVNETQFPVSFDAAPDASSGKKLKRWIIRNLPSLDMNVVPAKVQQQLMDDILALGERPVILNMGGKHPTSMTAALCGHENVIAIECDISKKPRTRIFSDPANVPLADESVDAVLLDALLEHVYDPEAVVQEALRVLKPGGVVYADAPFMLQVHGGPFDFVRYSHQALRWLFREFDETDSGISSGPGAALAFSIQYFLLSFSWSQSSRNAIRVATHLTLFWLKYFDLFLAKRPAAYDASHGFYFYGKKAASETCQKTMVKTYRGMSPPLYPPALAG